MQLIDQFAHELQQPAPTPERLALTIAGIGHPQLNLAPTLAQLDELAEVMRRGLFAVPPGRMRARHFLTVFNQEMGFTGNRDNYYEPANSFLNVVLERRTGLPIMLSLLCMAIGRRVGVQIEGVGFPGHFMARYVDEAGLWLLDPFNGEVIDPAEAEPYLTRIFHRSVTLPPAAAAAVSPVALAQRILNNLRNVYLSRGDHAMNARVLDYLLILQPHDVNWWQERGMMHYHTDQWDAAIHDLRQYFFLSGQNLLELGQEQSGGQVALTERAVQLLGILRQLETKRRQVN